MVIESLPSKLWSMASHLPLLQIVSALLVIIIVFYALAEKFKSFIMFLGVEAIMYLNTRERLAEALVASGVKVASNVTSLNPIVYMDRSLGVASKLPASDERFDLVAVVLVSFLLLWVYYMYLFVDHARKSGRGEWVPVVSTLLFLGSIGGGSGLIRYLRVVKLKLPLLGWNVSWFFLIVMSFLFYSVFLFYVDFVRPGRQHRSQYNSQGDTSRGYNDNRVGFNRPDYGRNQGYDHRRLEERRRRGRWRGR